MAVHQAEALPGPSLDQWHRSAGEDNDGPVLTDEQKSRIQAMKPMTKEEWDARQSVIRKVVDPETGRTRLIKGDGEVLEEIVTKERHRAPSVRRLLVLLSLVPPEEAAARLPGKHGDESGVRAEGRRSGAGNHPLRAEGKR